MKAPLNSKGTTSDWKNIKGCVREIGAFHHCPARSNVDDVFNDWLTSRKSSERMMAIHCKANTKGREGT